MKAFSYLLCLAVALAFASCSDDKEDIVPVINHQLIAQGKTASGKTVKLWADGVVSVSYTKVYVSVQNADSSYTGLPSLTLLPVMDMGSMKHSSPVEQPIFNSSTQLYEGGIVFSMPSGDMGSWQVTVKIDQEQVTMNINVKASANNTKYTGTFTGSDGDSYTLSLVKPAAPKIGINELVILINKRETMMSFPEVGGLTLEVTPEMPSMGHGSPNNVNPAFTIGGRYVGKVNFTMTGDWRLHFKVKKGETVIAEDFALDLLF